MDIPRCSSPRGMCDIFLSCFLFFHTRMWKNGPDFFCFLLYVCLLFFSTIFRKRGGMPHGNDKYEGWHRHVKAYKKSHVFKEVVFVCFYRVVQNLNNCGNMWWCCIKLCRDWGKCPPAIYSRTQAKRFQKNGGALAWWVLAKISWKISCKSRLQTLCCTHEESNWDRDGEWSSNWSLLLSARLPYPFPQYGERSDCQWSSKSRPFRLRSALLFSPHRGHKRDSVSRWSDKYNWQWRLKNPLQSITNSPIL